MAVSRLRILHVVESLDRGGLERVVLDLVREQATRGHRVTVAALYRPGVLAQELQATGTSLIDCGKAQGGTLLAWHRLRRVLARGIDAVHSHNPMSHYYAVAASLGLPRMTRVATRHGMGAMEPSARRLEWFFRRSLPRTDAVVTVCDAARRQFLAGYRNSPGRWATIRNGIDLARSVPRNDASRRALLAMLGKHSCACIVGCVGRLTPVKRHRLLIEAFSALLQEVPDACLVLVGDGPLRGDLQAFAENAGVADAVFFLGARRDVPELLAGFDVFAMTSASEGYSLALVEAAAAGLPMVASDVGGNREIIEEGANGLLFAEGDAAACERHLRALASNSDMRATMGARARAWALANGSLQRMADAYEALYRLPGNAGAAASHVMPGMDGSRG